MNDFLACAPIWLPVAGFLAVLLVETLLPGRPSRISSLIRTIITFSTDAVTSSTRGIWRHTTE